jgi:hypothetical protein
MLAAEDLQTSSNMSVPPQRHIRVVWFGPLPFLPFIMESHLEALITYHSRVHPQITPHPPDVLAAHIHAEDYGMVIGEGHGQYHCFHFPR